MVKSYTKGKSLKIGNIFLFLIFMLSILNAQNNITEKQGGLGTVIRTATVPYVNSDSSFLL